MWNQIEVKQGVLYKRWDEEISGKAIWQQVVPQCRRQEILKMVHDHSTGGHIQQENIKHLPMCELDFTGTVTGEMSTNGAVHVKYVQAGRDLIRKTLGKKGHVKAAFPIESVALDIMGLLPGTDNICWYFQIISQSGWKHIPNLTRK